MLPRFTLAPLSPSQQQEGPFLLSLLVRAGSQHLHLGPTQVCSKAQQSPTEGRHSHLGHSFSSLSHTGFLTHSVVWMSSEMQCTCRKTGPWDGTLLTFPGNAPFSKSNQWSCWGPVRDDRQVAGTPWVTKRLMHMRLLPIPRIWAGCVLGEEGPRRRLCAAPAGTATCAPPPGRCTYPPPISIILTIPQERALEKFL